MPWPHSTSCAAAPDAAVAGPAVGRHGDAAMRNMLSPGEEALLARFLRGPLAATDPGVIAWVKVFGSRARGASHEHSDLDVAVLAAPGADRIALCNAADAAWDAMEEQGAHGPRLSPVALPALAESQAPTRIYAAIEREGIQIWPPT